MFNEIKEINFALKESMDKNLKDEWHKACDELNAISESKKYWQKFKQLTGQFKGRVYPNLKYKSKIATTDAEKAELIYIN